MCKASQIMELYNKPKILTSRLQGDYQTPEVMQIDCSYTEKSSEEHTNVLTLHLIPVWWKTDPLP